MNILYRRVEWIHKDRIWCINFKNDTADIRGYKVIKKQNIGRHGVINGWLCYGKIIINFVMTIKIPAFTRN